MDMHTEPIRLPAIVTAALLFAGPVLIAVLLEQPWRVALATAIGSLIASGGVLSATESVRARRDSPATAQDRLYGLATLPLPTDERDHDHGVDHGSGPVEPGDIEG